MNLLITIVAIVLLLLLGVALLRLRVIIDTSSDQYEVRLQPFGKAKLIIGDGTIGYRWRALFMQGAGQIFPPVEKADQPVEKPTKKKKRAAWRSRSKRDQFLRIGQALWRSLRVRRFMLRMNTHDAVWNAWLYPVFSLWRAQGHDVALQFVGDSSLILDMDNSVHRFAGAFLHSYLTKSKTK
jgi:hypothetical protein